MLVAKITRSSRNYFSHIWLHPRYESKGGGGEKKNKKIIMLSIFFCGYLLKSIYHQNLANLGFLFLFLFLFPTIVWDFFMPKFGNNSPVKENTVKEDSYRVSVPQGIL
jgi:hypothetical protein